MIVEGVNIERECHSCIKIKADGKVVYIDPYKIKNPEKADIILITHEHADHFSLKDIANIFTPETTIVIPPVAHPPLLQLDHDINHLVVVGPKEKFTGEGWDVESVDAYNVNKFRSPGVAYHPKEDQKLGFILTIAGKRIYHAGDTDFIPEMKSLENIDIALLPVSGTFVMTPEEAVKAAETINPKVAIPIHYGDIVGTQEDAKKFKEQFPKTIIL